MSDHTIGCCFQLSLFQSCPLVVQQSSAMPLKMLCTSRQLFPASVGPLQLSALSFAARYPGFSTWEGSMMLEVVKYLMMTPIKPVEPCGQFSPLNEVGSLGV